MKSLLLSLLFVNSLLSFDYKLHPQKVGEYTHCFFGHSEVMDEHNNGNISNSCFVNMGASYLVIDSGSTFSYASQAYEEIKKIKNLPISYVANTHVHDDHWLGNSYYVTVGAKIIGSLAFEELAIEDITRMQKRVTAESYTQTKQIKPTIFVENQITLRINKKEVKIKSVNQKAHTNSDLYVYIPQMKIVFVGDLVFNDRIPSIRDGELNGWLDALDEIKSLDTKYIIGGHGKMIRNDSIEMTYNYIKDLRDGVTQMLEDGEEIADVVNALEMKEYKNINLYDSMHRNNVETAYRMLEWGI
ncbi:MBL fold metallo-hydrolase [Sulfurimonas aquatica]|uniref:MBL fold metallo-hydrolase n=1 Tax=Sulfurimonas aquatica TaxID=2672570 RepID=A0A975GD68_9BACT|nr:MBL fold metallo-hydrolase [Sulfurimonas aquatica]QSZ41994.1 MBL fold metallo-hydrolase [Sulfurimonas aquatica]